MSGGKCENPKCRVWWSFDGPHHRFAIITRLCPNCIATTLRVVAQ